MDKTNTARMKLAPVPILSVLGLPIYMVQTRLNRAAQRGRGATGAICPPASRLCGGQNTIRRYKISLFYCSWGEVGEKAPQKNFAQAPQKDQGGPADKMGQHQVGTTGANFIRAVLQIESSINGYFVRPVLLPVILQTFLSLVQSKDSH